MVGGGTVLGSTIRPFYRLRFSIAQSLFAPLIVQLIAVRSLEGFTIVLIIHSVDPTNVQS